VLLRVARLLSTAPLLLRRRSRRRRGLRCTTWQHVLQDASTTAAVPYANWLTWLCLPAPAPLQGTGPEVGKVEDALTVAASFASLKL
jgi:hypothetical protein